MQLWVASRKTLLRTNGSHDRCTIDFARSILRPFAYRLGRQATLIRLRLRFVMLSSSNKPGSLLPPKTLPRKRCFTFDPMCPENAMRSPLSDLAKRERVFSSYFLSHSRSEESGLCPSYRYPWETKRATEGKGCSLSLGLWRGEGREENVLRARIYLACAGLALRPRRHSGRKADHYISRHQSRREASYLSLIHLPGQGRERK